MLKQYQDYLTEIDTIYARAMYAQSINGLLPIISQDREMELIEAYHPLLYLNHQEAKKPTYPQDIRLHAQHRIIVISGPNAGGKEYYPKNSGPTSINVAKWNVNPRSRKVKGLFL